MSRLPDITQDMRTILVDWMVEVQENFELNHETLYLSVKIVDAYLDKITEIKRDKLQLVGVTAMFVACKYDVSISFSFSFTQFFEELQFITYIVYFIGTFVPST